MSIKGEHSRVRLGRPTKADQTIRSEEKVRDLQLHTSHLRSEKPYYLNDGTELLVALIIVHVRVRFEVSAVYNDGIGSEDSKA